MTLKERERDTRGSPQGLCRSIHVSALGPNMAFLDLIPWPMEGCNLKSVGQCSGRCVKRANPLDVTWGQHHSLNWVETEEWRTTQKINVAELAQSDTFIKWHFHGSWEVIITPLFYCSDIPALFSQGLCHCFWSIAVNWTTLCLNTFLIISISLY